MRRWRADRWWLFLRRVLIRILAGPSVILDALLCKATARMVARATFTKPNSPQVMAEDVVNSCRGVEDMVHDA